MGLGYTLYRVWMTDTQRGFVWARTVERATVEANRRFCSTVKRIRVATEEDREIHRPKKYRTHP